MTLPRIAHQRAIIDRRTLAEAVTQAVAQADGDPSRARPVVVEHLRAALAHGREELARRGLAVDWLVNNAGYGVPGSFVANDWRTHADFLRVLLAAPVELAWRLLPGMRERGYGRIVNVASLAGHVPGTAGHTLYAPAKAFLIKFSQGLAQESRGRGVHVCALCPGFTWSEFHDVTGTRTMMNKLPGFMWQNADAVVAEGIAAVERGTAVQVTGRVNRAIKSAFKLMPDRLAAHLSARQARRYRQPTD